MSSIYKYCSFNNQVNLRILSECQIPFDPPGKWIEDGECQFENDYGPPEEHRHHVLRKTISELTKLKNGRSNKIRPWLNSKSISGNLFISDEQLVSYVVEELIKEQQSPEGIEDRKNNIRNYLLNQTGIFCCSNILSQKHNWEHFSDYFEGFCIELDLNEIYNQFKHQQRNIYGGPIRYYQELPKIRLFYDDDEKKMNSILDVLFSLPSRLHQEVEFRLVSIFYRNESPRIIKCPTSIIKNIILGHEASQENIEQITNLIAKPGYGHIGMKVTVLENDDTVTVYPNG